MRLTRKIAPEYHHHTNLRIVTAHSTRDSLEYALLLFEAGGKSERATSIIDRILTLEDTTPDSKWYGCGLLSQGAGVQDVAGRLELGGFSRTAAADDRVP